MSCETGFEVLTSSSKGHRQRTDCCVEMRYHRSRSRSLQDLLIKSLPEGILQERLEPPALAVFLYKTLCLDDLQGHRKNNVCVVLSKQKGLQLREHLPEKFGNPHEPFDRLTFFVPSSAEQDLVRLGHGFSCLAFPPLSLLTWEVTRVIDPDDPGHERGCLTHHINLRAKEDAGVLFGVGLQFGKVLEVKNYLTEGIFGGIKDRKHARFSLFSLELLQL
ncbi:hypothetical protein FMUND_5365 [Fusarium mundagurra]|uniref:Uncharacterized protein n=1 Tax=Fusarium mundagurra TaxID=1567541 RepID=A0A8H5YTE8_9HYPO|nr:hypothetical protein FMUND_5365 [Fusarium mundagurra]